MSNTQEVVLNWIKYVLSTGGIARMDELHVDRIHERWKQRSTWIAGGVEAFTEAIHLRRIHSFAVTIALVFSLKPGRSGPHFANRRELESDLGNAPPSLYLFEVSRGPWDELPNEGGLKVEYPRGIAGLTLPTETKRICYFEFTSDPSDDKSRSLYIEA